jgi:CMP-N-acetylneuraminic acid synthetase
MIRNRQVTAIIPVRGGSKGIARKNLLQLAGDTLLDRTIKFAARSPLIERTIVTTDDAEMHAIAEAHGVAAPTLRPAALAADDTTTDAVVEHLIGQAEIAPGHLLLLQVTSPLRTLDDLSRLAAAFADETQADAAVSLCRYQGSHPAKMLRIEERRIAPLMENKFTGPRQSLPDVYVLNGAFYLIDRDVFLRERTFLPERTMPFVMESAHSANLDTQEDWQILQSMLAAGHWSAERYD